MPRAIAAFDLDGTLTEGGSVFRWLRFLAGDAAAYREALRLAPPLVRGAVLSGPAADGAKERLFVALLAGRDLDETARRSREFALAHLAARARPAVVSRLRAHRERGHDVVIVSASPELYSSVIAEALGADAVIATRLAVDPDARLTGRYEGLNCRGEEKRRRVLEWRDARPDPGPLVAYGNSRGDRRLLAAAEVGVDVGRLGRFGALRDYPTLGEAPAP